jgi:hypothetical protein
MNKHTHTYAHKQYSKPSIGDFNNDDILDFYVGGGDGSVSYFKGNGDGTFTEQNYDVFQSAIKEYNKNLGKSGDNSVHHGSLGAAVISSLIITSLTSAAVGAIGSAIFLLPETIAVSGRLGTYSSPSCLDVDGDGDIDCVVGYADGSCVLFKNQGTQSVPDFELSEIDLFSGSYFGETMASPFLYDFDSDGDIDVMVGYSGGKVYYYEVC